LAVDPEGAWFWFLHALADDGVNYVYAAPFTSRDAAVDVLAHTFRRNRLEQGLWRPQRQPPPAPPVN
jgi:hypothetical protein